MQRPRSPRSRVNPLRRKSTTAKNPLVFGGVMPRVKANRREIKRRDIPLVEIFIGSGGQIRGMRPIERRDVEMVIRYILDNDGEIPPSHRLAHHKHSTVKPKKIFQVFQQ
jgi:uncharacterized protein (UPF0248 family)